MTSLLKYLLLSLAALALTACAVPQKADYTQLKTEAPHSILIVPVVNHSVDVSASDYMLTTISHPLAERGYYVFPVHVVKRMMEDSGLGDADMVHANDPARLGKMFGADSILYVTIDRWDAKWLLLTTTVTVKLSYSLKSGRTGVELWKKEETVSYTPDQNNSPGLFGLIANAVSAAVTKAKPNYMPLARQANVLAVNNDDSGLPSGPYAAAH